MKTQLKKEPDHTKFTYPSRQKDEWGAVKNCTCKECCGKRPSK